LSRKDQDQMMRYGMLGAALLVLPLRLRNLTHGTTQSLAIWSNPDGASCVMSREGRRIGELAAVPREITVERSRHDLSLTCSKTGYQTATVEIPAQPSIAVAGNVVSVFSLWNLVGLPIDIANGAGAAYPSVVPVELKAAPVHKQGEGAQ
jgi:hypothetical protein